MKILCVSDQIDPLVYSDSIKKRFADIDAILCAGDLPLDYLDFIVSCLNKPLFFVFGNHHVREIEDCQDHGCIYVGSKVRREPAANRRFEASNLRFAGPASMRDGLIVAGLGGSMRYNQGPNQFTEFQMYLEAVKLIPRLLYHRVLHGRFLDILLTHAPPKGIHDKPDRCHLGFKAFLWFIGAFKPKYLVHGHIHLYNFSDVRRTRWKATEVINAYSHYVIDTAEDGHP